MKPENSDVQDQLEDDLRPEYDLATLLKGGVRGKYAGAFARGTNLVLLAPDVARAFPICDKISDMDALHETEKLLAQLTPAEKAQVLQWVARDLGGAFPGIESQPDVSGGEPRLVRTRIPVWLLVRARQLGTPEADILRAYPALSAEDLTNAWAYYRAFRDEIDEQIADNETA